MSKFVYSKPQVPTHKKTGSMASQGQPKEETSQAKPWDSRQSSVAVSKYTSLQAESAGCKHAELISYKVHREQFKTLMVPNRFMQLFSKPQAKEGEQKKRKESVASGRYSQSTDQRTFCSEGSGRVPESNSDSECVSTDGEETADLLRSVAPEKQVLKQSASLRATLASSQALQGDYVELKNCKRCGSLIFKVSEFCRLTPLQDLSAAIKHEHFNADISPAQLLTKMFQDEARYRIDHFLTAKDFAGNKVARVYSEQRGSLVDRMLAMGKRFNQRTKTLHIGVELMDRYFLDKRTQAAASLQQMSPKAVTLVMTTCFLIASKYDEIDDQLVFINDVQKHFAKTGAAHSPTWTDVVECERTLMNFFGWDLGFVLPVHYVEVFLANGVLYECEDIPSSLKTKQTAQQISDSCYRILDEMIREGHCFKNQGFSSSQVASAVVYLARQQVLNLSKAAAIWPKELQLVTRQTDKEVSRLASAYKKLAKKRHEPFHDDLSAGNHYGVPKIALVVDLTDGRSSAVDDGLQDPSLVSPSASSKKVHLISSEKRQTAEKDRIPVASIVVPGGRRTGNSNSGLKSC